MSKKSLIVSAFIFSFFAIILSVLFSCNVGLGDAVDTEVPKVEITYPPASKVVRDWFYLAGTCSDDKGVASISVSAVNTGTKETIDFGSFSPEKDGSWACKINEKTDGSYKLKDGTYTFCVIAEDSSKQKSAPNYRTFELDNTPPVFVIRNPGTTNADAPSSFGSILKIVGTVGDAHEIYELSLSVYENSDLSGHPKAVLSEKSIDKTDGINVTLARYNSDIESGKEEADELHSNYLKIYNTEQGGDQKLFATVTLKDSAEVWQDYTKNEASSIGNSTDSCLYLNDDVYEDLMSKTSKYGVLSAATFMKLINGTYNDSSDNSSQDRAANSSSEKMDETSQKEVLKILNDRVKTTSKTPIVFNLNKNANPTYEIMGFSFNGEESATFGSHKAAKQSSLTFKVQAGLDDSYVKPSSLKVYMFGPYNNSEITSEKLSKIYEDADLFYKSHSAEGQIIKDYSESKASSTETFTDSIELPSVITKGKYYVLAATGQDVDGYPLVNSNGNYFGFVGESAGTAPSVSITGFADGAMAKELSKISISGTLISEETEVSSVGYKIIVKDEINAKNVATVEGSAKLSFEDESSKLSAVWEIEDIKSGTASYENGYTSCVPENGSRFKYSLTVEGKDSTGLASKETKSFVVDMKKPEIKINDITPVAKKETTESETKFTVNGKVKFSAVITDTNLNNVLVTVTDGTNTKTLFEGNSSTIEKEFDTTEFLDENALVFKVVAADTAENVSEQQKTDVFVSQKTDNPEIKFTNGKTSADGISSWAAATNGQNAFGIESNNSANFTITDDDGLESAKVYIYDESGSLVGSQGAISVEDAQLQKQENSENAKTNPANPVEYKVDGSTSYALSYKLPQKAGKYKIQIEAFDTEYKTASEQNKKWHATKTESYIFVTEGNLSISFVDITNNTCQVKASNKTSVKGTVSLSDLAKLENIECFVMEKTVDSATNEESWQAAENAFAKYKKLEGETVVPVTAEAKDGKISWAVDIPAENIKDGEQRFYFKATDIFGKSASIELTCNGDGNPPVIKKDASVFDDKWKKSASVKVSVLVADINGYSPSGIDKVSCSYIGRTLASETRELSREKDKYTEEGTASESGKYYKYSTTIDDLGDGDSIGIKFTATDNVGNSAANSECFLKIDTTAPKVTTASLENEGAVLSKNDSLKINYSTEDKVSETINGSGIACLKISTNSNMSDSIEIIELEPSYTYALSDFEKFKDLSVKEYSIYVQAKDNAGNLSEIEKAGSFTVDNVLPKVLINTPASGSTVNKTISLSGTVVEDNLNKNKIPVLQYKDSADGSEWKNLEYTSSSLEGQSWSILGIDTTKLYNDSDSKDVEFRVLFTDGANNTNSSIVAKDGSETSYKLTINQNTDRPEIKLTNIKISGSAISSNVVQGVISDDDGVAEKVELYRIDKSDYTAGSKPKTSGSKWKKISVESGTGIWKTELQESENQGSKSWYFYVVDENGGEFCTASTSALQRIYLSDSASSKTDNTAGVSFFYDSVAPEVKISVSQDNVVYGETNTIFGGAEGSGKNKVYVKAEVTEEVGMSAANPVTLFVGGIKQEQASGYPSCQESTNASGIKVYTYKFAPIDISGSGYKDGQLAISVTAEDSAGLFNKDMMNITIDKTVPTVKIVSPTTAISDAVSAAISLKGTVLDNASSIERLMYTIPKKGVEDEAQEWKDVGTASSWEIKFASGAPDSTDSLVYYVTAKNGGDFAYQITASGTENIYKVPIWFKAKDSAGNIGIIKDQYVFADSEGGKPKAWINSPEEGATTSGVVTIYGGAIDNVSVSKVCVQIDANNDGNFDGSDFNYIKNTWTTDKDELKTSLQESQSEQSDWYILANGTNSWKLNVDSDQIPEKDGSKNLRIRVKAVDSDSLSREWTEPITVKIDSETPVIKNLKLVQYGSGVTPVDSSVPVTEREYISGMYISNVSVENKGKWYLVGEVSDNQSVSSITFEMITSSTQNNIRLESEDEIKPNASTYNLQVPLKTDESGVISYAIRAKDNNTGETTVSVTINIDSTAPSLYNTSNSETLHPEDKLRLKSLGKVLGTGSENATVINSDNYFTFGDYVSESGSGLAYLAFYFERKGSGGNRIYNPMFSENGNNKTVYKQRPAAPANGDVYINDDGLAAMYIEDSSRTSEDSINLSSANPNVRKGGLIKIAGSYSLITEVAGTAVKFSPTASASFASAEIIFAQVVDHQIIETPKTDGGVENDDGDEMVETINQTGSSYNWTASVNSNNIPDGPITIHVVAIDNAGNISNGCIDTKVENNRPRIAKVMLATDLNGNKKFDYDASSAPVTGLDGETVNNRTEDGAEFGEFSFYSAMVSKSTNLKSEVELKSGDFKVIGGLAVLPEFVGGNGDILYMAKYSASSESTDYKQFATGATSTGLAKLVSKTDLEGSMADFEYKFANKDTNSSTVTYADLISEKGGIVLNSVPQNFISFTFWDSTEETTPGTDSQWAHLMIPVTLLSSETEKPVPTITPFYWENKSENSVEKDKDGNLLGHIELEDDLTSEITNAYGDNDSLKKPKVSGKIKIEGTVTDNVRISSISIGFDDLFSSTTLANYDSGTWKNVSPLPNGVVSFEAEDVSISQKGHEAKFTLVVDTEKLTGVAGKDKNITISATDWKKNTSDMGTVQTTASAKTAMYTVDVVPYVTQVWTDLSEFYRSAPSVYARSAKGKYPVNENETITLKGYNLGNSPKVTLNGVSLTGSALSYNIGETAKSGKLEVAVGNIKAVNNLNNDTAEYNLQPNGVNNNILNDNLEFDVWQFKAAATAKNGPILQPHMKVGPSGELGFSYANATLYFNMPGKASDSTTYGQTPFGRNFGGFTQNTFTYDSNGNAYGVALCPDTSGEAGMSANLQFFSRTSGLYEGEGGGDLNNNYYNQNYARRIENTSIKLDGSSISQQINRILSPSMATYTENEITYVYVAYYDELSRQVRFRVGSVESSANNIGMGLVDLAGSSVTGRVAGSDDAPKLNKNTTRDSISGYNTSSVETINVASVTSDIYVRVKSSYNYNHIYAWNGYSTSSYPGDTMTLVNGYYIYKMPSTSSTSLLLNNTSDKKTADISISSSGVYEWNGSSLVKMTTGTISYQSPASSMLSYDGYKYCHVVAASGVSGGSAEYASATSKRAGQYVAVGSLRDGTAIMAWYDSGSGRLVLSYNESPRTAQTTLAGGTETWQNNSYYVSDSDIRAGTHVSMAIDKDNGVHLAYYSASGGDLYYSYIANPKQKNVTRTVMVDSYGSVGTYPMIDVAKDSEYENFVPYISFRCESNADTTASVKIAYPVCWDNTGNVLSGVDSYDRYTGNWEVSVVPTDNTPLTDYTNVGMNKNSSGVKKVFASGTDISKSWSATFAVSDSTTVYGNGTSNPVVSYAVSENGVLEMAQKK